MNDEPTLRRIFRAVNADDLNDSMPLYFWSNGVVTCIDERPSVASKEPQTNFIPEGDRNSFHDQNCTSTCCIPVEVEEAKPHCASCASEVRVQPVCGLEVLVAGESFPCLLPDDHDWNCDPVEHADDCAGGIHASDNCDHPDCALAGSADPQPLKIQSEPEVLSEETLEEWTDRATRMPSWQWSRDKLLSLIAEVRRLREENENLDCERISYRGAWERAQETLVGEPGAILDGLAADYGIAEVHNDE